MNKIKADLLNALAAQEYLPKKQAVLHLTLTCSGLLQKDICQVQKAF